MNKRRLTHSLGWLQNFVCVALVVSAASYPTTADAAQSWELWKINADGTGLAKFADTPGYTCGSPDWSPDGKFVAFDTWKTGQTLEDSQIAVVRADGKNRRILALARCPVGHPTANNSSATRITQKLSW